MQLPLSVFVHIPAVTSLAWETWNKCTLNQRAHTLAQLHPLFSPWRPASHSLWPASFPVARGLLMCRSALVPRLASWAETLPQNWEWCLCCLMWRRWAVGWALLPSDSSGCFFCSEGVGALALSEGKKMDHSKIYITVYCVWTVEINTWFINSVGKINCVQIHNLAFVWH